MPASLSPNPTRLIFLDILRFVSFYAIVVFHLTYALWGVRGLTVIPVTGPLVWPLENFARGLAFSGFTVLLISFFLIGFRGFRGKSLKRLLALVILFGAIWAVTVTSEPWEWDIYPLLLVALLLTGATRALKVPPPWVALLTAILLSIPFKSFECGEWPLLPFVFYPLFAWALGQIAAGRARDLSTWRPRELWIWSLALATSGPWLGGYFITPLGDAFGCHTFRLGPVEFWSHQIWLIFALRVSLLEGLQARLSASKWCRWISLSPVNRRFFVVYFAHYPAAFILAATARELNLDFESWILALTFATIFFCIEIWPGGLWRRANEKSSTT